MQVSSWKIQRRKNQKKTHSLLLLTLFLSLAFLKRIEALTSDFISMILHAFTGVRAARHGQSHLITLYLKLLCYSNDK